MPWAGNRKLCLTRTLPVRSAWIFMLICSPCSLKVSSRPRRRTRGDTSRAFRSSALERVLHADSGAVLTVAQVLGEHDLTAQGTGGLQNRGIPIGDAKALSARHGSEGHADRCLLNREAAKGLDQRHSLLVGQTIRAAVARRLDVELLQHLNREPQVA